MIYYLVPSSDKPSWGLAILYNHVRILVSNGIKACIVKEGLQCEPPWMEIKVPFCTVEKFRKDSNLRDTVIVPEVMLNFEGLKKIKAKKIIFVQAGAYLFHSMPAAETHISLGFEQAWIIMPHLKPIVEKHAELPTTLIPPFVAPYFFEPAFDIRRKKQILMYPKYDQLDYSIVKHIISKHVNKINQPFIKNFFSEKNWIIKDLKNLVHVDVAKEMKKSSFFISLNSFEALNTSVVEAMAAGCTVFCYEGFGPKDYLQDKSNAFVFSNNEAYKLAEFVCEQIDNFVQRREELLEMRKKAYGTAIHYSLPATESALINFFK